MAKTRWLSAPEQRAWRAYLEATTLLFDALDRQLQRDSGMPHAYYEILVRLSEADNRSLRMSELADVTRSSRSRLSHAVARLEERGWLKRVDCPTDKRGQIATLTDAGFAALEEAAPGHVETVRRFLIDRLTPEQVAQLEQIGSVVIAGLETPECVKVRAEDAVPAPAPA
ncbi:MAG TPA: MarR family transcriptional regulator [Jatrophihabitantaceae bacterium]